MLDTIVLKLNSKQFTISDHSKFTDNTKNLFEPPFKAFCGSKYIKSIQNPTKAQIAAHGYLPRLTVIKAKASDGFLITLKIELSAPKLMFGNNFDELEDKHFDMFCVLLKQKLSLMAVEVTLDAIRQANIVAIHYSKNIVLTDYTRCATYLDKLHKSDISAALDINQRDYRNKGHALKYHANSYELTFYDKLKDLAASKRSEKRAIENDNFTQHDFLEEINKMPKNVEILRMELRLNTPKKLNEIVKKVTTNKTPLTIKNLFSQELAQKVLLHYWSIIESNLKLYTISQHKPDDLIFAIEKQSKKLSIAKTLKLVGLATLIKQHGIRGVRSLFGQHLSSSAWYNLKNDTLDIKATLDEYQPDKYMQVVKSALQDFQTVKMTNHLNSKAQQ